MVSKLHLHIIRVTFSILFIVCIGFQAAYSFYCPSDIVNKETTNSGDGLYKVEKVIDGDTYWVTGKERRFKVRIIGVDTPETRNSQYKKKGYYGAEAKEFVRLLIEGKFVRLEYDVQSKDRYNRDLAYVYLEDGTFLNALLVREGYAVVATFPPNVRYVDHFLELQRQARHKRVGLWGE